MRELKTKMQKLKNPGGRPRKKKMDKGVNITIRILPALLAKIDAFAKERKISSRSACIRQVLEEKF